VTISGSTTISLGGLLTLNSVDGNGVLWRVNPDGFTGWGEPASTLSPTQKPRQSGAWAGDAFNVFRTMTIAGTITAPSPSLLNSSIDNLLTAVTNAGFVLSVTENGFTRSTTVRKQGETLTPKITNLIAAFSIQVVAVDPRKLGTPLTGVTLLPASTGGLVLPITVPFAITSTIVSGQVTLTNPGNEEGPVKLRIDGPCTGPVITHSGAVGSSLVFSSSLSLGVGEWLTIDMDKRTALGNDQASRSSYITSRGWSQFDPGVNVWAFAASAFNAASQLTVTATPAWK